MRHMRGTLHYALGELDFSVDGREKKTCICVDCGDPCSRRASRCIQCSNEMEARIRGQVAMVLRAAKARREGAT